MSTTEQGNSLEDRVFDYFSKEIEEGRFLARPENCRIFKKKGYYSKDREKEIVFDIAIEISFTSAATHSILCLVECKNYTHRVPVDDVEEFYAKTQQITPSNTKAIVASTNSFQDGAFKYAKSKGIGLLRYFEPNSVEWKLHRSHSSASGISSSNASAGLKTQEFVSRYFEFYCYVDGVYTNSIGWFFLCLIRASADLSLRNILRDLEQGFINRKPSVPFLEPNNIAEHCAKLLSSVRYMSGRVPLEKICQELAATSGLQIGYDVLPPGVLGTISFNPARIQIDDVQTKDTGRTRFTIAHEIGHLQLGHGRFLSRDVVRSADIDLEENPAVEIEDMTRMEWQANRFASYLLLPEQDLLWSVRQKATELGISDRGHGLLYLDAQPYNRHAFYAVTGHIMRKYDVSRTVVSIRLKELGLLVEVPNPVKSFATVAAQLFK
jgi:hypothetical protein